MAYDVTPSRQKEISWEDKQPTLAEMVEAAQKEFPGVPFEELQVTASGYDAELIWLKRKDT